MRYLKKFNESNYEDVKDFCEGHLVYLVDEGYDVKVVETNKNTFHITIKYEYGGEERKLEKRWIEIKNFFIPFYKMLNRKYTMLRLLTCGKNYQWSKLHYEVDDYTKSFTSTYKVGGQPHSCSLSFNNPHIIINDISDNQIVSQILIDIA